MDKASEITKSRRLLQNPYAYLDGGGTYSALLDAGKPARSLSEQITEHRYLLEDPYAYLDEDGAFSALPEYTQLHAAKKRNRYSNVELEQKAKELHKIIWKNRSKIWGHDHPSDPIDMLDPSVALNLIGYDFDLDETLGQSHINGRLIEVAGIIDNSSRRVRISRQFPNDVRVFTAAHELGHALLHEARGLHRDRPFDGATLSRDGIEFQADKFATYFLMPEKLVRARFVNFFATDCFVLNEETVFALSRRSLPDFQKKCKTLRDLARALANAEYYDGLRFVSMARQFRVSIEAMAIRLEELGLLAV
ncbi:MAG: ImmA/IrrE family metallo-endopeptidase [Thiobacillus sp.]